jgi:hypothetical protein
MEWAEAAAVAVLLIMEWAEAAVACHTAKYGVGSCPSLPYCELWSGYKLPQLAMQRIMEWAECAVACHTANYGVGRGCRSLPYC